MSEKSNLDRKDNASGSSVLDLKYCDIPMVIQDLDHVLVPSRMLSPLFKTSNDGQEFLSMDLVVPLGTGKTLGHESYWVPLVVLT